VSILTKKKPRLVSKKQDDYLINEMLGLVPSCMLHLQCSKLYTHLILNTVVVSFDAAIGSAGVPFALNLPGRVVLTAGSFS
jgi:hypothetical protein